MIDGPTRALRSRSPELLRADLARLVVEGRAQWLLDWRDLLVALAPYHDCATRLGLDPTAEFAAVAAAGPEELRDLIRSFGRRDDITPGAFGFRLVDAAEGPRYEWT
ncbi:MAG TPA: hypothetical protein VNH40_07520 [Gaiellaceae bacterium]|nr:hypothetical protein [Gaiellaceae bacterium]